MKIRNLLLLFALPLFLCSCSSFKVTQNLEEALAHVEDDIKFTTKEDMKDKPMFAPKFDMASYKKGGKLNFLLAFDRGKVNKYSSNYLSDREWSIFRSEFENAVAGCRRFPVAQNQFGLADKQLRKETRSGGNAAAELDASKFKKVDGILNLRPVLSVSESQVGREKTVTNTFKLTCNPLDPATNSSLERFPEFSLTVSSKLYQLTDRFGRAVAGFRLNTRQQLEDYHLRQARAAIVKFFVKMYRDFPVTGEVRNIDDGIATIRASRAEGLQPNMEMVISAFKKSDGEDAILVPLYNATVVSVGASGTSTLQIWRKSDKKSAKKIIKMIENDINEAREEYEFFAAADSFAQWPDFIDRQNTTKK